MLDLRDRLREDNLRRDRQPRFRRCERDASEELERAAEAFADGPGAGARETTISFSVEARYPFQVWEIPLPLRTNRIRTQDDVAQVREDFHALHQEIFAIQDTSSEVELVTWSAHVSCRLRDDVPSLESASGTASEPSVRESSSSATAACRRMSTVGNRLRPAARSRVPRSSRARPKQWWCHPARRSTPAEWIAQDRAGRTREDKRRGSADGNGVTRNGENRRARAGVDDEPLGRRRESDAKHAPPHRAVPRVLSIGRDFSCVVLTANDEVLSVADSLPIHVFSGPDLMAKAMRELHPEFRRGDAFLNNSPYHGNSHAADWSILVPVFDADDVHRFTVVAKAHLADCGNSIPTSIHTGASTSTTRAP